MQPSSHLSTSSTLRHPDTSSCRQGPLPAERQEWAASSRSPPCFVLLHECCDVHAIYFVVAFEFSPTEHPEWCFHRVELLSRPRNQWTSQLTDRLVTANPAVSPRLLIARTLTPEVGPEVKAPAGAAALLLAAVAPPHTPATPAANRTSATITDTAFAASLPCRTCPTTAPIVTGS